jgi:hypothetical protein
LNTSMSMMISKSFSLPYKCILGVLQRCILIVPDRLPTRTLIVDSILMVISTLYEVYVENTNGNHINDC